MGACRGMFQHTTDSTERKLFATLHCRGNASSTATAAGASAKAQPVPDLKRKAHAEAEQPNKAPKLSFKPPDPSAPAARGTMLAKACTTKPKH